MPQTRARPGRARARTRAAARIGWDTLQELHGFRVIHRALAPTGRVHELTTRPDLDPVGGVGALLRF